MMDSCVVLVLLLVVCCLFRWCIYLCIAFVVCYCWLFVGLAFVLYNWLVILRVVLNWGCACVGGFGCWLFPFAFGLGVSLFGVFTCWFGLFYGIVYLIAGYTSRMVSFNVICAFVDLLVFDLLLVWWFAIGGLVVCCCCGLHLMFGLQLMLLVFIGLTIDFAVGFDLRCGYLLCLGWVWVCWCLLVCWLQFCVFVCD